MPKIELGNEEIALLRMMVESRLSDLAIEIAHTDSRAFKQLLRERRTLLEGILARLARSQIRAA